MSKKIVKSKKQQKPIAVKKTTAKEVVKKQESKPIKTEEKLLKVDKNLVFSIGETNGSDAEYYLNLGYKVVIVEANPEICEKLSAKFSKQINSKEVVLVNMALSDDNSEKTLFVNNIIPEFSSLKENLGSRIYGSLPKQVSCCTLNDLFEKYGIPYFVKLEIEASEYESLSNLIGKKQLPEYISFAFSNEDTLELVESLGYNKFQLIDQQAHGEGFPKSSAGKISNLLDKFSWKTKKALLKQYEQDKAKNTWFHIHAKLS